MATPTDIYDAMLPIYIISKILGLAPFKIAKKQLIPEYGLITPLRIFIILGGLCYIAVLVENVNEEGIAAIALKCEFYLGTFMTFIVLMLAPITQKDLINIIEQLADIDKNLKSICIKFDYGNSRNIVILQTIFITCLFFLKTILQYFSHIKINLTLYSIFNFVDYIDTVMLLQYTDLLLFIRNRFEYMKKRLRILSRYAHPIYCNINEIRSKPFLMGKCKNMPSVERLEGRIVLINSTKIYTKLCEISRFINRIYNIQIFVSIMSRFVMITTQLINTYNTIRDSSGGDIVLYMVLFLYIGLHFSKIFMVANVSASTSSKAKEIAICIHDMWGLLPEFNSEIQNFSLQILHQNLKFTACGFFTLDQTLIHSVIASVTTYFIIVIQLEKMF